MPPPHVVPSPEKSVILHVGYRVYWATIEVLDGPIHVMISMIHTYKVFIIFECYGPDYYTLRTPIPPLSVVPFLAKLVRLHG